uniref:Transmembrane protein TMEM132 N-terminal domain-containing protein n=1 Tax=Knipowitschia caucasica TaxID=637954 RepID=A0AAV2MRS7_KNICA
MPTYLPVNYQLLNAEQAFFLKEANQDFMRNSSLMSRTESFFIYQARGLPSVNASYGPLSVVQPIPLDLLQTPGTFPASSLFTFNWKLEPLASWFSPPSVVPGRQKNLEVSEGTPVELYYTLQSVESGECHSEDARKDSFIRSSQEGMFGSYTSTPLKRIGGLRLYQNPVPPPLTEHRLDHNFVVQVPAAPIKQRETVSAFISVTPYSSVEMFTLSTGQLLLDMSSKDDAQQEIMFNVV